MEGATHWRRMMVLWVGVILSAVAVVNVSHLCRQLYSELATLQQRENHLQVEWGQYLLEQSSVASLRRVEKVAVDELGMHAPSLSEVIMVEP